MARQLRQDLPAKEALALLRKLEAEAARMDVAARSLLHVADPDSAATDDDGDSMMAIEGRELDRIHAAHVGGMNRMAG